MLQIWIKDVSGWPNMTCLAFYISPPKLGFNMCWSIFLFFWPRSQKNPLSFQGDEELPGGERCLLLLPHGEHPEVQEETSGSRAWTWQSRREKPGTLWGKFGLDDPRVGQATRDISAKLSSNQEENKETQLLKTSASTSVPIPSALTGL